jgi:hypothetical protein
MTISHFPVVEYPLHKETSDTMVMHCSDPRFQEAFSRFVHEQLGIEVYDPFIVPGASQILMFTDKIPKFANSFARPLEFLIKGHHLKRVVIIMHEDCAWYRDFVPKFFGSATNIKNRQVQDMLAAKRMFQESFEDMSVEMYYATINPDQTVFFSRIEEVDRKS